MTIVEVTYSLLSDRPDKCFDSTSFWLNKDNIPYRI
jgi:hypothetical protein